MRWRLCRIFYRARSRYQRRRLLMWTVMTGLLVSVVYFNQQGLDVLSSLSQDSLDPLEFRADTMVGRQPRAVEPADAPAVLAGPVGNGNPNSNNKINNNKKMVPDEEDDDKSDLRSDLAPAILHFLWCGKRHFEFRHYMAMKRANTLIRPDKVLFHYEVLPVMDKEGYYLWFNKTLADIDNVLPRPVNTSSYGCALEGAERFLLVMDILERFGGIYVPEDALLVDFPVHLRSSQLVAGVRAVSPQVFRDGLIAGKKSAFKSPTTGDELLIILSLNREEAGSIQPCGSVEHYNTEEDGDCICVKVESNIFPKDVWELRTAFGTLARLSAYGSQDLMPLHDLTSPIPRIAHYICVDCEVRFIAFLSMRSAVNVAGLSRVYLHGVKEPHGKWWDKLKEDSRFVYVHREYPETLYDRVDLTRDLAVGIMRIAILLKYGGVYCDEKVLWTQRIPDAHFGYTAVASPDWHLHGSWPDSVNHAVLMAKKNAPYLLELRAVLIQQTRRRQSFWFSDHFMAYKVLETQPRLLLLDRHLQVKCLNHNCHPTWAPNYRSGQLQNRPGPAFHWGNDTLSVHWTDTFPELDMDTVKYTSGMVVEVCRNILRASGMVIQDLRR
ncbi:uncharacterized protein LOC143298942 isoform X2 [Babylonia areolata]